MDAQAKGGTLAHQHGYFNIKQLNVCLNVSQLLLVAAVLVVVAVGGSSLCTE